MFSLSPSCVFFPYGYFRIIAIQFSREFSVNSQGLQGYYYELLKSKYCRVNAKYSRVFAISNFMGITEEETVSTPGFLL